MITKHVQSMSRYAGQKVLLCNIIIDQNRKMVRDDNEFSRYTGIHSFGTCNIDWILNSLQWPEILEQILQFSNCQKILKKTVPKIWNL